MVHKKFFKDKNEFSLHIEQLKIDKNLDTYTDTILHFYEYESDHEIKEIVRMMNKKLVDSIKYEAEKAGTYKEKGNPSIDLSELLS